jgi:hypothetical protein
VKQLRCEVKAKDQAVDERYGTENHDAGKRCMWLMVVLIGITNEMIEISSLGKSYERVKEKLATKRKRKRVKKEAGDLLDKCMYKKRSLKEEKRLRERAYV